jgi:hypothetical protein
MLFLSAYLLFGIELYLGTSLHRRLACAAPTPVQLRMMGCTATRQLDAWKIAGKQAVDEVYSMFTHL